MYKVSFKKGEKTLSSYLFFLVSFSFSEEEEEAELWALTVDFLLKKETTATMVINND